MTHKHCFWLYSGSTLALVLGVLRFHAVDNELTREDRQFIPYYLAGVAPLPDHPDYAQELVYIRAVQQAVLKIAPVNNGLPEGQLREPMELYLAGSGLCYDRSRVIEKILNYAGFQTRHIFILSLEQAGSRLHALISPGTESHAVTEVLTQKSWLVVDSNTAWISLSAEGTPVSMDHIQADTLDEDQLDWFRNPPSGIYTEPFTFLYGLHSRHGRFFPPYNPIPDIQYSEFADNLF